MVHDLSQPTPLHFTRDDVKYPRPGRSIPAIATGDISSCKSHTYFSKSLNFARGRIWACVPSTSATRHHQPSCLGANYPSASLRADSWWRIVSSWLFLWTNVNPPPLPPLLRNRFLNSGDLHPSLKCSMTFSSGDRRAHTLESRLLCANNCTPAFLTACRPLMQEADTAVFVWGGALRLSNLYGAKM